MVLPITVTRFMAFAGQTVTLEATVFRCGTDSEVKARH